MHSNSRFANNVMAAMLEELMTKTKEYHLQLLYSKRACFPPTWLSRL